LKNQYFFKVPFSNLTIFHWPHFENITAATGAVSVGGNKTWENKKQL